MGVAAELRDPAGVALAVGTAVAASFTGLPLAAAIGVGAAVLATKTATAGWLDHRAGHQGAAVPVAERVGAPPAAVPEASQAHPAPAPQAAQPNVFRPEGEYWTIGYHGSTFRLKDAKGLRHLHRMLAAPGREFHVADLAVAPGETRGNGPGVRLGDAEGMHVASLDAGALLDPEAKAAYRQRLEDLREEADEARSWGDGERASRAEEEIEALAHELARAVGLHGNDRKAASATERARVNVTRAVKAALDRIAEHDRSLGHHLSSTVRTGTFCCYAPGPDDPPTWQL